MLHHCINKKGFTLAEVLITLGIIGVVAVLTIPTLIQNYKKQQVETSLKKIYTTVNQAIQKAELDHGDYHTWTFGPNGTGAIEKYFIPYLNVVNVVPSYDGSASCTLRRLYLADGSLLIAKACVHWGFWMNFCYYPKAENWKGQYQNRGCLIEDFGRSSFSFQFSTADFPGNRLYTNAPFQPYVSGELKRKEVNAETLVNPQYVYSCNKDSLYPRQCAALIMYNNWKIPKDYPFRLK
jgi:prepilin-type cleavage/methylation N-terminal domain protein